MTFGYDTSMLHHAADVVLSATFQLDPRRPGGMHRVMQENLSWRGGKHPWLDSTRARDRSSRRSTASVRADSSSRRDSRGFGHGDAQISHIHANIVVNLGHATAADVRALIAIAQTSAGEIRAAARAGNRVRRRVLERTGVRGQGSGVRGQGSGVRGQGSGVRGQGSGVRGQGSGVRGQGPVQRPASRREHCG